MNSLNPTPLVFIAEDNPGDVYLIREALNEHAVHCAVRVAEDGEQASRFIDEVDQGTQPGPDLMLLDLNLPRVSGRQLLEQIRATAALRHARVVVFTSSDSPQDQADVDRLGADRYIRKPATLDAFLAIGDTLKKLLEDSPTMPS